MVVHTDVIDDGRPYRKPGPRPARVPTVVVGLLLLVALAVAGTSYWWLVQRVEVRSGEVLILIRKVGETLPAKIVQAGGHPLDTGQQTVLFPAMLQQLGEKPESVRYKGILFQPLPEGRYFYDPFFWERIRVPAITIAQDELGVLVRKFGRALEPGKLVATEPDERGPEAEVLKPGRYNINPYAYEVRRIKPVIIPAGYVGVQTLLSGPAPANPNKYVVEAGERGVQPEVLPPGMYYNNPYVRQIIQIDVRSQTIDLHDQEAIRFPSNDSFPIFVDCTVEYAVRQDQAPYVLVAFGSHEDIRDKLILPYARSLCRIEGSKLHARDFIAGETRSVFQNRVFDGLREQCYAQGIEVRATLIRRIVPPAEIAGPISDRQVAEQQIAQYQNEMKLAEAEAKLVEQEEMQKQNRAVGEASREVVTVVKQAEQSKAVAITEAKQRHAVAKLQLEAAREKAAALLARGQAEAEVARLRYEAEAKPLSDAVAAFGGGQTYAQYHLYQKLGPALKSVLASTEGPFADIFRALAPTASAGRGVLGHDPGGALAADERQEGGRP